MRMVSTWPPVVPSELTASTASARVSYSCVPLVPTVIVSMPGPSVQREPPPRFWKGLPPQDREALSAAVIEGAAHFDELMLADEAASMARAASEGGKVVPAEDREGWQAGARKVWTSFAPQLGGIERIEAIARSG